MLILFKNYVSYQNVYHFEKISYLFIIYQNDDFNFIIYQNDKHFDKIHNFEADDAFCAQSVGDHDFLNMGGPMEKKSWMPLAIIS